MRSVLKYITVALITAGITLISLFLPSELSKWQDRQSFGSIHLEKAEDIKVERNQQMSILEKLSLFINPENTSNQISIRQGKYLKEEDIPQVCEREINRLEELGVIKNMNIDMKSTISQFQLTFYLSTDDPTKSMIVWSVDYIYGKSFVNLNLDDETGKILSFTVKTEEQMVNTDTDEFMEGLGEYYGISVDSYSVKRTSPDSDTKPANRTSFVAATFSEGNHKLDSSIQIYPNGWFYFGYYRTNDQ
jgi:hypothetical protein